MSSRTKRASILAFSNLLNFSVQFLSPIILVRILDQESYGQYKEFYLYAGLAAGVIDFSIRNNLLYFIAKSPNKEKQYITNTIFLKLSLVLTGIFLIYIFQNQILLVTTYNFIIPLLVYIFVAMSFDFLDIYWLSKKRSDYVLYYSIIVAISRLVVIITVAYLTEDVYQIIYSIIIVYSLIMIYNVSYLFSKRLVLSKISYEVLKEQIIYIFPLGLAGVVMIFNRDISKIIITNYLGASALALYAVASQRLPITNIIRSSVTNVIFPDMAEMVNEQPRKALNLWNRSVVIYLFLMLPLFFLMLYYSHFFIVTLFTEEYAEAIPVFQIYLIFFLKQSFDMGPPIRAMNKNKFLLVGHILSFFVNVTLLYVLYNLFGFIGPAIAFVVNEILLTIYFGNKIMSLYKVKVKEFLFWKKLALIFSAGLFSLPVLFLGDLISNQNIISVIAYSIVYFMIYFLFIRMFKIDEVKTLTNKILPEKIIF